jgi:plasmid stability protein
MSVLTVSDVPDEVAAELQRRAAAHGVSEKEELLRILEQALGTKTAVALAPKMSSDARTSWMGTCDDNAPDWLFDRHDIRYGQALLPPGEDFKAHLLALGEIGADLRLDWPRTASEHRAIDL